jgi:hypothetical protein
VVATTKPVVALKQPVVVDGKVRIALIKLRGVQVEAVGPGEIAGPALAVTLRLVNRTSRPVDLSYASVDVIGSDGQVASPTPEPPADPFRGKVAPGASAEGTYVFNMAESVRDRIDVYVSYSAGVPVAHFRGSAK